MERVIIEGAIIPKAELDMVQHRKAINTPPADKLFTATTTKVAPNRKKKEGGIEREKVPEAAGPLESVAWSRHAAETCLKGRKEEKERKGTNQNKKGTNQTNQMISRS